MSGYRVKIGDIEIFVDTIEDLKKLIKEFGGTSKSKKASISSGDNGSDDNESETGGSMDKALLKRFIEADRKGIPSIQLHIRLGANKMTLKTALVSWAKRLNFWHNNFEAIFEYGIFSGTNRGYRLTKEALGVGKDILGMK